MRRCLLIGQRFWSHRICLLTKIFRRNQRKVLCKPRACAAPHSLHIKRRVKRHHRCIKQSSKKNTDLCESKNVSVKELHMRSVIAPLYISCDSCFLNVTFKVSVVTCPYTDPPTSFITPSHHTVLIIALKNKH